MCVLINANETVAVWPPRQPPWPPETQETRNSPPVSEPPSGNFTGHRRTPVPIFSFSLLPHHSDLYANIFPPLYRGAIFHSWPWK